MRCSPCRGASGPIAGLDIPSRPSLLKLANVHHLGTSGRGTLAADRSVLSLAGALHPPAAVCGTPASGRQGSPGADRAGHRLAS